MDTSPIPIDVQLASLSPLTGDAVAHFFSHRFTSCEGEISWTSKSADGSIDRAVTLDLSNRLIIIWHFELGRGEIINADAHALRAALAIMGIDPSSEPLLCGLSDIKGKRRPTGSPRAARTSPSHTSKREESIDV